MSSFKVSVYKNKYVNDRRISTINSNTNLDFWDGRGYSCGVEGAHKGLTVSKDNRFVLIETHDDPVLLSKAYHISDEDAYRELTFSNQYHLLDIRGINRLQIVPIKEMAKSVNLKGLKLFCKNDGINEMIIFGPRVLMNNYSDDPLSIMILDYDIPGVYKDYSSEQVNHIKMLYERVQFYIKDKDLGLDFKVVNMDDRGYHGITYGKDEPFDIYWHDLPLYISITPHAVSLKSGNDELNLLHETRDKIQI